MTNINLELKSSLSTIEIKEFTYNVVYNKKYGFNISRRLTTHAPIPPSMWDLMTTSDNKLEFRHAFKHPENFEVKRYENIEDVETLLGDLISGDLVITDVSHVTPETSQAKENLEKRLNLLPESYQKIGSIELLEKYLNNFQTDDDRDNWITELNILMEERILELQEEHSHRFL